MRCTNNFLPRPTTLALAFVAMVMLALAIPATAEPPDILPETERADRVLIEKAERRLTLLREGRRIATYRIALGFAPEGHKEREGDGRTPEGFYRIDRRNENSQFYLSLGIDYPRPDQRAAAEAEGRKPGGDIFIHGQPHRQTAMPALPYDWTAGCAAVSNAEIEEIWQRVEIGTVVEIRP